MENRAIRDALSPRASRRNIAAPLLVGTATRALERTPLSGGRGGEDWLQKLIDQHPEILPIAEIEPGFGTPIALARELPCGHGFIDNLLITPQGQLVLVEAKLWSNPQARREVVGQALDYVAALMAMGFIRFEQAVIEARGGGGTLYQLVEDLPDALDEARFIDAVDCNLKLGRMLVLIVGDGISAESERLAELLASRIDAHFTLALVELAVYALGQERLVVPSIIARTLLIERGVVRAEGTGISIEPPRSPVARDMSAEPMPKSISDEEFDALMDARRPGLAADIREFAASLEPLGAWVDQKRSLAFKINQGPDRPPINLGYIQRNGQVWTETVSTTAPPSIARGYLDRLAAAIGGAVQPGRHEWLSDGKSAPRVEQLLPDHAEAWREAIRWLKDELASIRLDG